MTTLKPHIVVRGAVFAIVLLTSASPLCVRQIPGLPPTVGGGQGKSASGGDLARGSEVQNGRGRCARADHRTTAGFGQDTGTLPCEISAQVSGDSPGYRGRR